QSGPFTIPGASAAMPAASTAAPSRSANGAPRSSRYSRRDRAAIAIVTSPTGTFTRKTQRQLASTSRPPIGGPAAAATPPTAAHRAHRRRALRGRELGQQQPEGGRDEERGAGRLQHARADEHKRGGGDGT